jgi:hypothetical protein
MKSFVLFFVIIINVSFAQEEKNINEKKYFMVLFTTGENWDASKKTHEQEYFKDHSSSLVELRKSGDIILGGRYSATGMILLLAKDEQEAEDLITKDKSVQNKIFNAAIFPFSPFYKGCIE